MGERRVRNRVGGRAAHGRAAEQQPRGLVDRRQAGMGQCHVERAGRAGRRAGRQPPGEAAAVRMQVALQDLDQGDAQDPAAAHQPASKEPRRAAVPPSQIDPFGAVSMVMGTTCHNIPNGGNVRLTQVQGRSHSVRPVRPLRGSRMCGGGAGHGERAGGADAAAARERSSRASWPAVRWRGDLAGLARTVPGSGVTIRGRAAAPAAPAGRPGRSRWSCRPSAGTARPWPRSGPAGRSAGPPPSPGRTAAARCCW